MPPETPIEAAEFLWGLASLCGVQRVPFDARAVLQLVALATPLCTQVIIDKVVAHHSSSTLMVILSALAIFVVFSAALSYARQHLLLHTGNRVDSLLGMRAFEHLLRLPPRYFETRPTGTLVARLHGVETIREFITNSSRDCRRAITARSEKTASACPAARNSALRSRARCCAVRGS